MRPARVEPPSAREGQGRLRASFNMKVTPVLVHVVRRLCTQHAELLHSVCDTTTVPRPFTLPALSHWILIVDDEGEVILIGTHLKGDIRMCLRKLPRLRGVPEQSSTEVEDGVATVLQFHHVLRRDVEAHSEQSIVPRHTEATQVAPEARVLVDALERVVSLLQKQEVLIPLWPTIAAEEQGEQDTKSRGTHGFSMMRVMPKWLAVLYHIRTVLSILSTSKLAPLQHLIYTNKNPLCFNFTNGQPKQIKTR